MDTTSDGLVHSGVPVDPGERRLRAVGDQMELRAIEAEQRELAVEDVGRKAVRGIPVLLQLERLEGVAAAGWGETRARVICE